MDGLLTGKQWILLLCALALQDLHTVLPPTSQRYKLLSCYLWLSILGGLALLLHSTRKKVCRYFVSWFTVFTLNSIFISQLIIHIFLPELYNNAALPVAKFSEKVLPMQLLSFSTFFLFFPEEHDVSRTYFSWKVNQGYYHSNEIH